MYLEAVIKKSESRPKTKTHHLFGYGTYFNVKPFESIDPAEIDAEIELLGWSHGCPVVREISDPDGVYGPKYAYGRYSQCNFAFREMLWYVNQIGNDTMYRSLTSPISRQEKVDIWYPDSVSFDYKRVMAPMTAPPGYAAPRLLIDQYQRAKESGKSSLEATEVIAQTAILAAYPSLTPTEYIINLANRGLPSIKTDAELKKMFSHLFAQAVLNQQNCQTLFNEMVTIMDEKAPQLRNAYQNIPDEEKLTSGIIIFK